MRNLLIILLLLTSFTALAQNVGDTAPDFSLPATNGKTLTLKDFRGKWLVLYFYPKAFTPGCTAESCSLRDGDKDIQKTGAQILGVSLDDVTTQKKFKTEYKLPFELLSDSNKTMSKAYGTLGFLGMYSERKTFLIDPQGKLRHVFTNVNTAQHAREVLKTLQALQK
jgi:peroxiredoxin Q/BCP